MVTMTPKIITDHGWPKAYDGNDANAFDAFKNERDYIAQGSKLQTTAAAMDWAAREIERLESALAAALSALAVARAERGRMWEALGLAHAVLSGIVRAGLASNDIRTSGYFVGQNVFNKINEALSAPAPAAPANPNPNWRCPTCDSPQPHLHPAVQYEGEVQICKDPWHSPTAPAPDERTT